MNIFDIYLNKIKNIVTNNSANLKIPQNLSGINVDTAPANLKLIYQQMSVWFFPH